MANHDRATITVMIAAPQEHTFRLFVEDIDRWWRHGFRYRTGPRGKSEMRLEPGEQGRLIEVVKIEGEERQIEFGRIVQWMPPYAFAMRWRNINFAEDEFTLVQVNFSAIAQQTKVVLVHSRLSSLRDDHPARHGQLGREFVRSMGMWWGDLLRTLAERVDELAPEDGSKGDRRQN